LKWLRTRGYPWDKFTIVFANMRGHADVVRWARENGCACVPL
jgi:hypothetical protein